MSNLPIPHGIRPRCACSISEKNNNDCRLSEEGDLSERHVQSCHARFSAKTHLIAMKSIQKQQKFAMEKQPRALSLHLQEQQQQQQDLPSISGQFQSSSNHSRKSLKYFLEQTNDNERIIDSSDVADDDSQSQHTCNDMFDFFQWSNATSTNKKSTSLSSSSLSSSLSSSSSSSSSSSPPSISTKATASASTVVASNGMNKKSKSKQQRDGKSQRRKLMTSQDYFLKRLNKRCRSRVVESVLPPLEQRKTSNNNDVETKKPSNASPAESPPAA